MELIQGDKSYAGKKITFNYTTEYYYDVEIEGFNIRLKRKKFSQEMHKSFTDELLNNWLEDPELYVFQDNHEMIGLVEISKESWNNRLRISNLWVCEKYRHQGIGTLLMKKALQRANELKVRAVVLETQSCNDKAIRFYLKQGFELIGLDTMAYSNEDIQKKEVRIEMGIRCKTISDKV